MHRVGDDSHRHAIPTGVEIPIDVFGFPLSPRQDVPGPASRGSLGRPPSTSLVQSPERQFVSRQGGPPAIPPMNATARDRKRKLRVVAVFARSNHFAMSEETSAASSLPVLEPGRRRTPVPAQPSAGRLLRPPESVPRRESDQRTLRPRTPRRNRQAYGPQSAHGSPVLSTNSSGTLPFRRLVLSARGLKKCGAM